MMTCREAGNHLALYAGGDLDPRTRGEVCRHLETCASCLQEVADYKSVTVLARDAFDHEIELPLAARSAVVRGASERAARHPWWGRLLPLPGHPALAAMVPAALVLLAVTVPFAVRGHQVEKAYGSPVRIDMMAEGGTVRLAWTDGRAKPYRVYKSTNPRQLGRGPAQEVKGSQWVDSEPDSAHVVFYRVE